MTLWVCDRDGVRYSVGAPRCPQCGAPASQGHEQTEADDMPKIDRHDRVTYREAELAGEAGPWSPEDGTDSQESSKSGTTGDDRKRDDSRSNAPTTGNPSDRTDQADSSARSTAGDQTDQDSQDRTDQADGQRDKPAGSKSTGKPANSLGTAASTSIRATSRPK